MSDRRQWFLPDRGFFCPALAKSVRDYPANIMVGVVHLSFPSPRLRKKGVIVPELPINHVELRDAFERLKLHTEVGHEVFREKIRDYVKSVSDISEAVVMKGFSRSNIKNMRSGKAIIPKILSNILIEVIFREIGLDVTKEKILKTIYELGMDIQINIDVKTHNLQTKGREEHDLENFYFEINEANAVAEDPEKKDFEIDLRIGFDQARMTLISDEIQPVGNYFAAETPRNPDSEIDQDYSGWFQMRLAGRDPLNWVFSPKLEGDILKKRVDAERIGRISTASGAGIVVELTARREALKVRVVGADAHKASKTLSEQYRNKMCAAVARRCFVGTAEEFLIYRKPLKSPNQN